MTTPVTAVAFDLGGVLIDWNPRHLYREIFGADEPAMERFLAEIVSQDWNARLDSGRSFAEAVAELAEAHPDQAAEILAYHDRWHEMLGGSPDGTVAILRELRDAGLPTYALSNWSAETFPGTRQKFPFLDEMDGVLISGEARVAKPDPAIFREFLARFELTAASTVFIDDWDRNVAAASACGLIAIQFVDAAQLRRDLRALGLPLAAE
jgi:2-haloacid dehalogenase